MSEETGQLVESDAVAARAEHASAEPRLRIQKTYKLYIGGKFPRTESGRYERFTSADGATTANLCRASRKDFREAVVAARAAQSAWAARTAYNRGQILYRVGEMLEGRAQQFTAELRLQGLSAEQAGVEVEQAIDRWVYFAGWADKFQQVFSSVNPVASSHFNFSVLEPTGVVALVAPERSGLLGLVANLAPIIASGNTCVLLASRAFPLSAITLAEVLHSSDVPGGVVNILTGQRDELCEHFASHLDVNAVVYCGDQPEELRTVQEQAVHNLKRVVVRGELDWSAAVHQSPYPIADTCEVKTTWHPIGS